MDTARLLLPVATHHAHEPLPAVGHDDRRRFPTWVSRNRPPVRRWERGFLIEDAAKFTRRVSQRSQPKFTQLVALVVAVGEPSCAAPAYGARLLHSPGRSSQPARAATAPIHAKQEQRANRPRADATVENAVPSCVARGVCVGDGLNLLAASADDSVMRLVLIALRLETGPRPSPGRLGRGGTRSPPALGRPRVGAPQLRPGLHGLLVAGGGAVPHECPPGRPRRPRRQRRRRARLRVQPVPLLLRQRHAARVASGAPAPARRLRRLRLRSNRRLRLPSSHSRRPSATAHTSSA